jgi:hypothetical protein
MNPLISDHGILVSFNKQPLDGFQEFINVGQLEDLLIGNLERTK